MSFISTGSYPDSPGLSIRAGVYYCQQAIAPQSGLVNYGTNYFSNAKICGNYDFSNFECGYTNFEFGHSGRTVDYHRKNGYQYARDGIVDVENFSTAIVLSGTPIYAGDDVELSIPSSSVLNTGEITVYGRFKINKRIQYNDATLLSFGTLDAVDTYGGPNGILLSSMGADAGKILFYVNKLYSSSPTSIYKGTVDVNTTVGYASFYSFLFTLDSLQTFKLYEAYDNQNFLLTNVQAEASNALDYTKWYGPTYLQPLIENGAISWTDFGVSNRAWTALDIQELSNKKTRPGLFIYENPDTVLPSPSGSDTTYLNFHFNSYTRGNCGLLHQSDYQRTDFYVDLDCNLSSGIYEFERSQYNPTALKIDMWTRSDSTNPSGYVNSSIVFTNNYYWSGYPVLLPQNELALVTMSGQIFDNNGNLSDLDELSISAFQDTYTFFDTQFRLTARLGLGAWYRDIGTSYSGDINIYSARVYADAWCTIPSTGNSLTLYTSGQYKAMESLDLFLQQSTSSGSTDLFIQGVGLTDNSTDLFIAGGFRFDSTTLYIGGLDTANSGCSLYMDGGIQKATMPLHIYSAPPSQMSGNIPLSVWATTNSGTSNGISLFVGENAPSGVKTAGMNLYVKGPESARITAGMNLFLKREAYAENNSLTLYCANEFTGASGNLTLYMSAPSGTLGAIPVSGSMNLFINRSVESVDGGMTMYTSGPQSAQQAVEMYINGGTPYFSSIPLSIDGIGVKNNTVKFYTHGF